MSYSDSPHMSSSSLNYRPYDHPPYHLDKYFDDHPDMYNHPHTHPHTHPLPHPHPPHHHSHSHNHHPQNISLPFRHHPLDDRLPEQPYLLCLDAPEQRYNPSPPYDELPLAQSMPRWNASSSFEFNSPPCPSPWNAFPSPAPYPAPRLSPPPPRLSQEQQHQAALNARRLTLAGSLDPETGIFYRTPEHPRLRTAQACEKCRARKAKCTGDCPCGRCASRGLVCEYAKEGRVRGPNKPKAKLSSTTASSSSSSHTTSTSPNLPSTLPNTDLFPRRRSAEDLNGPLSTTEYSPSGSDEGKTPPMERRPRLELDRWDTTGPGVVYPGPASAPPATRYDYLPPPSRDEQYAPFYPSSVREANRSRSGFTSSPHTNTSDESPPTPVSVMHFSREGEVVAPLYSDERFREHQVQAQQQHQLYREEGLSYARDEMDNVVGVNVSVDHFGLGVDGYGMGVGVGVGVGVGMGSECVQEQVQVNVNMPLGVWDPRKEKH